MERESQCLFRSSGEPRDGRDWNRTIFNPSAQVPPLSARSVARASSPPHIANRIRSALDIFRNPSAWHPASYREPRRIYARRDLFRSTNREEFLRSRGWIGRRAVNQKSRRRGEPPSSARKIFTRTCREHVNTELFTALHMYYRASSHFMHSYKQPAREPFQIPISKEFGMRVPCEDRSDHTRIIFSPCFFLSIFKLGRQNEEHVIRFFPSPRIG